MLNDNSAFSNEKEIGLTFSAILRPCFTDFAKSCSVAYTNYAVLCTIKRTTLIGRGNSVLMDSASVDYLKRKLYFSFIDIHL